MRLCDGNFKFVIGVRSDEEVYRIAAQRKDNL